MKTVDIINTNRLNTLLDVFHNSSHFDHKRYDPIASIREGVSKQNFPFAMMGVDDLSSGLFFYPEENKAKITFCELIKTELIKLAHHYYDNQIEDRVNLLFGVKDFNLNTAEILPAISYDEKNVLDPKKLEEAIVFFTKRDEHFDLVIVTILEDIALLHKQKSQYGKDA
jgi:hypothetical protein